MNPNTMGRMRPREMREAQAMEAFGGEPGRMRPREMREAQAMQAFGGNPLHPQQADPPGFIPGSKAPRGMARHASQGIFGTGAPSRTSVRGANTALTVKSAQSRRTRATHGHKAKRRAVAKKAASGTQAKTLLGLPWIQTVGIAAGMLASIAIAASTILNLVR